MQMKTVNECNNEIPNDFSLLIEPAFMKSYFHNDLEFYKRIFNLPIFLLMHSILYLLFVFVNKIISSINYSQSSGQLQYYHVFILFLIPLEYNELALYWHKCISKHLLKLVLKESFLFQWNFLGKFCILLLFLPLNTFLFTRLEHLFEQITH